MTDNVIKLDLSPQSAKKILQEVAKTSSRVLFTRHAERRMKQRNITRLQVIKSLQRGLIIEGPVRDVKGNWNLTIQAITSGDEINVVAAIDSDSEGNYIIVITTY